MGANLTGSVPSKLVSSNLKLLKRTSYLLFHACQSETEMERFQSPTKLQVPCGEKKKTWKVNQRLGINVQWKSLAVLVTYIFVNISHLSSCFRWFHFLQLRSILMQLGSIFSCLPQKTQKPQQKTYPHHYQQNNNQKQNQKHKWFINN